MSHVMITTAMTPAQASFEEAAILVATRDLVDKACDARRQVIA